jgi:NADPH:quinone reductase-like Zn-dependent oxidoreductase
LKFNNYIPSELKFKTRQGALAEYIRVPTDYIVLRPSNITPVQAAGITLVAMTSYQGLIHVGKLESEQTVLINGGSSAVGAFAIQIAKAKGAHVVATASGKNEAFVRQMGADEVRIL